MRNLEVMIVYPGEAENGPPEDCLWALDHMACTRVFSARQAVEAAAERCPDVALIDLKIEKEFHGIEAAELLGEEHDIPVLYMTDGNDDLLQRAEATQPYGYVVKPIDPRQLRVTLLAFLSLRQKELRYRQNEKAMRRTICELRGKSRVMDTILHNTKDGIVASDAAGRILFCNSQAERIVGTVEDMKPSDLCDASERQKKYGLFELDKETYLPTDQLPLVRALKGVATDDKEVFIRNERAPEGVHVTVRGRTLVSDDCEAKIEGGVVFFRDTTREKQAEADLQQTLAELRDHSRLMGATFESMHEGVFVTATDGSMIWASSGMQQMIGAGVARHSPVEWPRVYGFYDTDEETMIPANRLPMMRALRGEVLEDEGIFIRNERRPEGLRVNVSGRPLKDDNGEIEASVVVFRDITRQKLAEARLEESIVELHAQARLMQTVLDGMEEGVVVADKAGNFLLTNERREQIVGVRLIAGKPDDWPATFGAFCLDRETQVPADELPLVRAMRGDTTEEVEFFIRNEKRPDGAYVRARGRPLLDGDSNVIGGVAIFSDITKYKDAESELERTIDELQMQAQLTNTVFESISDGVVVADVEGNFTIFNSGAERIIGKGAMQSSPDQWTRQYGFFHADRKTPCSVDQFPLFQAMQGKSTEDVELFVRNEKRPDGVFISVSGRPLPKNDGACGGGVITFRDVTKRKAAEDRLEKAMDRLRDQSELLEATFSGITEGIAVVNPEGVVIKVNPAAKQIAGVDLMDSSQAQLMRKWGRYHYADRKTLIPPEDLPLKRAIVHGEVVRDMDIFVRNRKKPDGYFIRVSAQPLRQPDGLVRGGVAIFRDVTDQLLAEEALIRAFGEGRLEIIDTILHNIGNAISSVTIGVGTLQEALKNNRFLMRLRTLADALKAHQDDWVDYIAYDPQGQKVLPYVVQLVEGYNAQQDMIANMVARVEDRANHIADIIRTQKALDRPHMTEKHLSLERALGTVIKVLEDSLNEVGAVVEVHCDSAPREIRIQESQFHQMMINLIRNAMEAIADLAAAEGLREAPRICIHAYTEGDFLHLDVADNGIGIDSKNLKAIFAAGYTSKPTGSGLGLHSAANFVIGTGGKIQALSDGIGKGATLRVMLRQSSITPAADKQHTASGGTH